MTEIDELLDQAKRRLLVADHFLTQTYPVLQDPKLLVSSLDSLLLAANDMLGALVAHEHELGTVPNVGESFAAKLALIKGEVAKKYGFTHVDIAMLSEMQELQHEHKRSEVEFSRKGAYVMASKDYALSTITIEKLKTYTNRAKTLFTRIHDRITQR